MGRPYTPRQSRLRRVGGLILILVCVGYILCGHPIFRWLSIHIFGDHPKGPPTYRRLKRWEWELPQHNLDLPYPEGRTGRYVKFTSQVKELGWNNVLNEVLMCAHLAYASDRAYVFQDYVWKREYYPWPTSRLLPKPRTPLNALIAGPTAGGPWEPGDNTPRSISEAWFDVVCPPSKRRIINTRDVKPAVKDAAGDQVFAYWQKLLKDAPENCIEIVPQPRKEDNHPQVFDLWLWGSERILPLWESFSKSPTSRLLSTSPLVASAVTKNEILFLPRSSGSTHAMPYSPYARMLAIHIRRGDFKEACLSLATWNSTFYSWNLLPFLPDKFTPPAGGSWGYNTPENVELYMQHCLPTGEGIVRKIAESRRDYEAFSKENGVKQLDTLYLLTNEEGEWLDKLKRTLQADGWNTIVTSKDLELDPEQLDVSMAVDMEIARKAAVFIGNGVSAEMLTLPEY
ncbi:hypothetical protein AX16_008042 [Volvariella volvacea WC 439]|nr:hypothetical protein AX16_008042 [Volvariella volvacea WC 439]